MSNALVVYTKPDDVRVELDAVRPQLIDVLPNRMDADRFIRVVAKAIIGNPKLMECTRASLLSSVMEAAQLGLEPTGLLGSAYLVPYRRKFKVEEQRGDKTVTVERYAMVAQLIPGYRGLIDLARRSGEIDAIQADVVRQRDQFDYEPTRQPNPIIHRPYIPDPSAEPEERDRGPIVGVYMLATLRGGFRQPEWMTIDEVEAVRKRSRAADDGPWVTDYPEMSRKTVVRRGSKYLPLTTEFRRALELDEEAERDAEPPVAARPLSRAAQLLVDRASASGTDSDGRSATEEGDNTSDVSDSRSDQSGAVVEDATEVESREVCGDEGETGTCAREPGHPGPHRNEQGVWPKRSTGESRRDAAGAE